MSASGITYKDIYQLLTLGFTWELRTPERRARGVSPQASVVYRNQSRRHCADLSLQRFSAYPER